MKRVLLLCAAGITTSLLTKKLDDLIKVINKEYQVVAYPIAEVATQGIQAEVLLLSPQVRFNYAKIKHMFPDKLVLKIDAEDYKNLNAEKIINDLKSNLK